MEKYRKKNSQKYIPPRSMSSSDYRLYVGRICPNFSVNKDRLNSLFFSGKATFNLRIKVSELEENVLS